MKDGALHVMTLENPELQYAFQFEECGWEEQKYPLSEHITFRQSRQRIRFTNYGGLLAVAYLLNDFELFSQDNFQLGLVVVNEQVKEIHKMSCLNYQVHPTHRNSEQAVTVSLDHNVIGLNRLSQEVELEFYSMLARITQAQNFTELLHHIEEIFVHNAATYQQFKNTLLSLALEQPMTQTVQDFTSMLEVRAERIREAFKGRLYTYTKYHTLSPVIKYALPHPHQVERKLVYKEKLVTVNEVIKHIRNKDNIVIVEGI